MARLIRAGNPADLEVGIWTFAELADWFDISKNTFSNQKKKRLAELSRWCEWEECGKGKIWIIKLK